MDLFLPLKSLLLAIFRLLKGKPGVKELAAATGIPAKRIGGIERGTVKNALAEELELLLISMECSEAEVVIMSACLEGLAVLDPQAEARDTWKERLLWRPGLHTAASSGSLPAPINCCAAL